MYKFIDAQAALGFVVSQRTYIETQVMRKPMPEIQYSSLIPIDTSANSYAPSVTFFTADAVGRPKLVNGRGDDVPLVNTTRTKFEQTVSMAAIGYSFTLEEIGAAQQYGQNLSTEGAMDARQAYEQFVDEVAFSGIDGVMDGLFNMTGITSDAAAATFRNSTPDAILTMINKEISAIMTASLGIEIPDTMVMPIDAFSYISSTRIDDTNMTILQFLEQANVYTAKTKQPFTFAASHRLTADAVLYRRDPQVLKMHIPMPLQFIAPQIRGLEIITPGMFRFAGVSIRRPAAVRYLTGVTDPDAS